MKTKETNYITLLEGNDYRTISKVMTEAGFQMNHATARNGFMSAMSNLIDNLTRNLGMSLKESAREEMLKNQDIHDALIDILFKAHEELKAEKLM